MHELFKEPQKSVLLNGKEYEVNTDFRVWLEISEILADKKLSDKDKILCLLLKGYTSQIPPNINDAVEGLILFMGMNKKIKATSKKAPLISFSEDEGIIYASFLQQYGIDLYVERLHWWKFIELLNSLDERTIFMRVVGYRSIDISVIKDREQKRFYRKMKNKYKIGDCIEAEDIAEIFELCEKNRGGEVESNEVNEY